MRTINLLPKHKQSQLFFEDVLRNSWVLMALTLASFAFVLLVQIGEKLYLKSQTTALNKRTAEIQGQLDQNENAKLKEQVAEINDKILDYKNLAESAPKWSEFLRIFAVLPPAEVQINSLSVEASNRAVTVAGFSQTREAVLAFYEKLKAQTSDFENVDFYFENVAKPTNVAFHFSFIYKQLPNPAPKKSD